MSLCKFLRGIKRAKHYDSVIKDLPYEKIQVLVIICEGHLFKVSQDDKVYCSRDIIYRKSSSENFSKKTKRIYGELRSVCNSGECPMSKHALVISTTVTFSLLTNIALVVRTKFLKNINTKTTCKTFTKILLLFLCFMLIASLNQSQTNIYKNISL